MAANIIVDAGFLVALLNRRDDNHNWAAAQASAFPRPWKTCEPALAEAFCLLGASGTPRLIALLARGAVTCSFQIDENRDDVVKLLGRYADVPMSLAEACLVRMTEILSDPTLLTTDVDFQIYRRHNRQTVPCILPR
jgi:uncharacterized protein